MVDLTISITNRFIIIHRILSIHKTHKKSQAIFRINGHPHLNPLPRGGRGGFAYEKSGLTGKRMCMIA
jgi:hypothetical protein